MEIGKYESVSTSNPNASVDDDDKNNLSNQEPDKTTLLKMTNCQNVLFSPSSERLSSFGVTISPSSSISSTSNLHRKIKISVEFQKYIYD